MTPARGEPTDFKELAPHSSGFHHTQASYWPTGALETLAHLGTLLPAITYGVDGEGRISTVTDGSGHGPVTAASYNSASQLTALTLGSGDSDAFQFDPNTGRMTQYKATIGSQSMTGTLGWNASGSLNNLVISDPFNSADSQTCNYLADDLARLSSANCGTIWGQTFSYDAFGNISWSAIAGSAGSTFQPTYVTSPHPTNKIASLPGGFTPTYDANGNSLNDDYHTRAWDGENRPVTEDSTTLTYNALGQMVEVGKSGVYTDIIYSPLGKKLSLVTGGTTYVSGFVPLPHGANAVYNSSGALAYYRHPDWLGSSRLASTPGKTMYFDTAYSPVGEAYASSGTTDLSFTGQDQNSTAGIYDFPARK